MRISEVCRRTITLGILIALVGSFMVAVIGCKPKEDAAAPSPEVSNESKANMAKGYEMMQKQEAQKKGGQ